MSALWVEAFRIPFSHLPSCKVEDDKFKAGLEQFIRVACMVKNFKGMRIGQIGTRPIPFYSVMYNEGELTPQYVNGLAPCAVLGLLNDLGYMIACENDIHYAMTMAVLKCATLGQGIPLYGEFTVRHPKNENAELLWHCGQFPLSQKAPDCEARIVNQREWFRGKDGTYTAARIDQESGDYMMLPLICKTTEGPETNGTYIWGEFEDLQKIEDRLLQGPYIHHFIEIEGDYRKELEEFCKYVPNLRIDRTLEK